MTKKNCWGSDLVSPLEVLANKRLRPRLESTLLEILTNLNFQQDQLLNIAGALFNPLQNESILFFEEHLHKLISQYLPSSALDIAFENRAITIEKEITEFLVGESLIDVGCGDGRVAWLLKDKFKKIAMTDIVNYVSESINLPFIKGTAETIPVPDKEYDVALLLTVLHHATNPIKMLTEAKRISKKRIIIIESIIGAEYNINAFASTKGIYDLNFSDQLEYAIFIDWLYNRVLHYDVAVPYNFATPSRWRSEFSTLGLKIIDSIDLGIDQLIVPEHHWLFVLSVKD